MEWHCEHTQRRRRYPPDRCAARNGLELRRCGGVRRTVHPEGTFTNVFGDRYIGQEAFQARHAAIVAAFAKGSKASLDVRRVFFAAPGMALVDIDCVLN